MPTGPNPYQRAMLVHTGSGKQQRRVRSLGKNGAKQAEELYKMGTMASGTRGTRGQQVNADGRMNQVSVRLTDDEMHRWHTIKAKRTTNNAFVAMMDVYSHGDSDLRADIESANREVERVHQQLFDLTERMQKDRQEYEAQHTAYVTLLQDKKRVEEDHREAVRVNGELCERIEKLEREIADTPRMLAAPFEDVVIDLIATMRGVTGTFTDDGFVVELDPERIAQIVALTVRATRMIGGK